MIVSLQSASGEREQHGGCVCQGQQPGTDGQPAGTRARLHRHLSHQHLWVGGKKKNPSPLPLHVETSL